MPHLSLAGVAKHFSNAKQPALAQLTLDLDAGQTLVLVGPSGCGKSTALRIIAGLTEPDAGTVSLDGRSLAGVAPQERDIAMVFQGYALYPHMTVRENIEFPLKMRGIDKAARRSRADDAASMLGLEKLMDRLPGALSGGERQRVAMGRAIVREPKLFLFDEPLSNLDAALRTELRIELAKLLKRIGATSIYVTHDQVEAMTLADELVVMQGGRALQRGAARTVYEAPATTFVAGFLGAPAINTTELDVQDGAVRFAGEPVSVGEHVKQGRIVWALRPEHIHLVAPGEASSRATAARVLLVESFGASTVIHAEVALGDERLEVRALAPGFHPATPGSEVLLRFDHARAHWFEPTSGRSLA